MDRFWIKQYPPGTSADIDPNEYSSVKELIELSCKKFATRTAYLQMGFRLSYAELDRLSAQFAGWLQSIPIRLSSLSIRWTIARRPKRGWKNFPRSIARAYC